MPATSAIAAIESSTHIDIPPNSELLTPSSRFTTAVSELTLGVGVGLGFGVDFAGGGASPETGSE
jgi:hypothetical protein